MRKIRLMLAAAAMLAAAPLDALSQSLEVVRLNDATPLLLSSQAYEKYITRSNFTTLTIDNLVFSESIPGKLMADLLVTFFSDTQEVERIRYVFDELIEEAKAGETRKLRLFGLQLGKPIALGSITYVNVELRLIPVTQNQFDPAYQLLAPILSKPLYGVDITGVMDKFAEIANSTDKRPRLLFKATIPVPQNVIEAQRLDGNKNITTPPLHNNLPMAIEMEGAKEVTDASVLGKVKDAINGAALFIGGRSIVEKPTSKFRGFVSLRFTKDRTQALSEALIENLKSLSDAADNAFTPENVTYVGSKHTDSLRLIEAAAKAKQIDSRAEFHLRSYIDLARLWALHKNASAGGKAALRDATNWQTLFSVWHGTQKIRGGPQLSQAYGVSDIYQGGLARVFIPYSLTDDMTLELIQRQISIHQSLAAIGETQLVEQKR